SAGNKRAHRAVRGDLNNYASTLLADIQVARSIKSQSSRPRHRRIIELSHGASWRDFENYASIAISRIEVAGRVKSQTSRNQSRGKRWRNRAIRRNFFDGSSS